MYVLNSTKRLIYKIPIDLSTGPQLHFDCQLNEKMEKIYTTNDGFYLLVVFADQTTVIIINNILKKIQVIMQLGPGILDCGFIFEDGETNAHIEN